MLPTREIALPGRRTLTYDDVGDPGGVPVVYLHGTPDSRLARHPDDGLAARAGVRLLAVDRPGYGGTSPLPPPLDTGPADARPPSGEPAAFAADDGRPPSSQPARLAEEPDAGGEARPPSGEPAGFAADLAAMLDELGLESVVLVAWSGGALDAIRVAAAPELRGRLRSLWLVGGLVPADAYTDPVVRAAAANRLDLQELADSMPAADLAEAVAPLLAPYPCDLALARDHQREQRPARDQRALEEVPGAVDRMAAALVEAVRGGLAGVEADIRAQVEPLGDLALRRVGVPVRLMYGSEDLVTPPELGAWYARHLPRAELEIVEGAGHYLPFTHWSDLLAAIAST